MFSFLTKEKYEELLARATKLGEDNAALQMQTESLNQQVGQIATLQEQITALTTERDTAKASLEDANGQIAALNTKIETLTQENTTLRSLPGAETAITRSETEQANGEAMNDLDKLNEFCKNNSQDINACMAAVQKVL